MTIPPPTDKETHGVTLMGSKDEVHSVKAVITSRLKEVEAQLVQEKKALQSLKRDQVRMTLPVAPNCH